MTAQLDQMQTQLLSQPPPSIILPRSEALRYVEICELAEMMPPSAASSGACCGGSNFLTQLLSSSSSSGSGGGDTNDSSSDSNVKKYASIIQMAFLLYLGEYTHARHLWRRLNNNNNSHNSNDDEYKQLTMFWNAAKYCYLWNTGGIMSGLSTPPATDDTNSNEEEEIRSNLPYSTLMLRSLQSNSESSLEPLATYSRELVSIFCYRVNERLRMSFNDIRGEEFMLRMNLSNKCAGAAEEEEDVLGRYGWKRIAAAAADNSAHLVPDREWKLTMQGGNDSTMTLSVDVDRIRQLSEVVMFLEQTKMNA
jgi:hypothetical protein